MDDLEGNLKKEPSFMQALIVFLSIVAILILGLIVLEVDLHVLLILGLCVAVVTSLLLGYKWQDLENAMCNGVSRAMSAMFIFILIGMIVGAWIQAGTVPALIYYGLNILSAKIFLPAGLIICSIAALATGSSWSTVGTVGLALMGIGQGLGIPPQIIAGMIISGAYFGDKMSPLSDTTNLAPISAGTDLYTHIKAMLYSTVPTYIICIILYSIIGLRYSSGQLDVSAVREIQETLAANFNLNLIVLLPMIVTLTLSVMKVAAIPAMAIGSFLGSIMAIVFQNATLAETISVLNYGFEIETGLEIVDGLLNRGGIQSMMWTFSLAFCALSLGGVLDEMGYMSALVEKITKSIKKPATIFAATIISSWISVAAMGEQYLSIILNGRLYKDAYEKEGLAPQMLSRALEEGGTLGSALIPWTTCATFAAPILGVPTTQYAPWAFFNWMNPLISIVMTYLGIFVLYKEKGTNKVDVADEAELQSFEN